MALASPPDFGSPFGPCEAVHPWFDSCVPVPLERFKFVFKWSLPLYGALHFIPMLLFKRNVVFNEPMKMLTKAGVGTLRSSTFFGMCVVVYQCKRHVYRVRALQLIYVIAFFCFKHHLWTRLTSLKSSTRKTLLTRLISLLPQNVIDILVSKLSFWIGGLLIGMSLFIEDKHRRGELAMYVLPKALESAWIMLRGKGIVFKTGRYGDALVNISAASRHLYMLMA